MFGLDADRRPPGRAAELQPYLRALEPMLERFRAGPASRADTLADSIAERLSDMAGRLQDYASRTGSQANRLGGQLADSGRGTAMLFSKEVSANPLVAVGAALALGAMIGIALMQWPRRPARAPARKARKGSNR
jgi:hypothetical protein